MKLREFFNQMKDVLTTPVQIYDIDLIEVSPIRGIKYMDTLSDHILNSEIKEIYVAWNKKIIAIVLR